MNKLLLLFALIALLYAVYTYNESLATNKEKETINLPSSESAPKEDDRRRCLNDLTEDFLKANKIYAVTGDYVVPVERTLGPRGWYRLTFSEECPPVVEDIMRSVDLWFNSENVGGDSSMMNPDGLMLGIDGQDILILKVFLAKIIQEYWEQTGGEPFVPTTMELHSEEGYQAFIQELEKEDRDLWIVKPAHMSGGEGIHIVDGLPRFSEMYLKGEDPKEQKNLEFSLAQKYITNPLLLNGRKFDFRVYLLIAATEPMVLFYHSGYIRVNIEDFDLNDITNTYGHITNIKQQQAHPEFEAREAESRWTFEQLEDYLQENNLVSEPNYIENVLEPLMMTRIGIAVDAARTRMTTPGVTNQFTFLGVDFILDENLKPWLIEMTKGPAPHYSEKITFFPQMLSELFNIVFELQDKRKNGESFDVLESPKTWIRI